MRQYKVETDRKGNNIISYEENGVVYSFIEDTLNSDYQAYLKAAEENNG
jgi:hypothetical protein